MKQIRNLPVLGKYAISTPNPQNETEESGYFISLSLPSSIDNLIDTFEALPLAVVDKDCEIKPTNAILYFPVEGAEVIESDLTTIEYADGTTNKVPKRLAHFLKEIPVFSLYQGKEETLALDFEGSGRGIQHTYSPLTGQDKIDLSGFGGII
jgi:hypothetical protein